jgi:hypothetical protein
MKIASIVTVLLTTMTLYAQEPPAGARGQLKIATMGNFGFVSDVLVGGNPVKGAPYSAQAVTETTQTLADGTRIVQKSTAMIYRDSLGRQRREQTLPAIGPFTPQGDPPQIISISDPVAGVNYSLNPKERIAVKLPNPPGLPNLPHQSVTKEFNVMVSGPGPAIQSAPALPNMIFFRGVAPDSKEPPKVDQLGWKLIEGLQAEGTRTTITIPAGQIGNDRPIEIVDEQWRSPDLQVIVYSRHSDPRIGETVYSLVNVNRADPAPGLFQVPPDYTLQDKGPIEIQKFERGLRRD